MTAFSKIQADPGRCFVGHWNNIAITVWLTRPDGETAKSSIAFTEELRKTYSKFSVLHIPEAGAGLPTSEARDEFVAIARSGANDVVCVAVLLPEENVFASMLRAFVRGVRTLLRGDLMTILEQDVDLLARQLAVIHARGTGVRIAPDELVAAIADMRRRAAEST